MDDKPQPPANGECCETGCEVCVWDVYFEALAEWEKQRDIQAQNKSTPEES